MSCFFSRHRLHSIKEITFWPLTCNPSLFFNLAHQLHLLLCPQPFSSCLYCCEHALICESLFLLLSELGYFSAFNASLASAAGGNDRNLFQKSSAAPGCKYSGTYGAKADTCLRVRPHRLGGCDSGSAEGKPGGLFGVWLEFKRYKLFFFLFQSCSGHLR